MKIYPENRPQFFTSTIPEWKPLLNKDKYKDIIIDGLDFAIKNRRINLFAFVIMDTHFHTIWQQLLPYSKKLVQQGFMKYIVQKIKHDLLLNNPA